MRHPINPLVDCVFAAIFGDPENADLLLSLLNAVLRPKIPIREVQILNPSVPREFQADDQRILDVRARIQTGDQVQLEVQLQVRPWMATRVLYTWADLYQSQIQRGASFRELQPVVSIWVLGQNLLPRSERWHHRFEVWDQAAGLRLSDHLAIHTLELSKWAPPGSGLADEDRWMYFLREAGQWTALPQDLQTPELQKAMRILERFSDKERDYHDYQSRMNFLREQAAIEEERAELLALLEEQKQALVQKDQALVQKDQALVQKELALEQKDPALLEKEKTNARLRAMLQAAGLSVED